MTKPNTQNIPSLSAAEVKRTLAKQGLSAGAIKVMFDGAPENARGPKSEDAPGGFPMIDATNPRVVFLIGEVSEASVAYACVQIMSLNLQNNEPITLFVNTYGGSIHEMYALYDVIQLSSAPVRTFGLGKVMSAGVLILASGQKGHRAASASCSIMVHAASGGARGTIREMATTINHVIELENRMWTALAHETGRSAEDWYERTGQGTRDVFLSAEEAKELGIIDTVLR
jgi:ATP-dependent Clp protease protease subunit